MKKYATPPVIIIVLVGLIFIVLGQGKLVSPILPNKIQANFPADDFIKAIGLALIGSGVFTTILKTREYTKLFDDTFQRNLYSHEALEKRDDKEALWRTLTRMLYNNKFPDIREQLEDLVSDKYFLSKTNWYVTNYDITLNISNHRNPDFWMQSELLKATVIPADKQTAINYAVSVTIDRPETHPNDVTSCNCLSATINNRSIIPPAPIVEPKKVSQTITCAGQNESSYQIVINRDKALCKSVNPQKTFIANQIIKNMSVTIYHDQNMILDFKKAGTINEFVLVKDHTHENTRIRTWVYEGLILPEQGYIIIFK